MKIGVMYGNPETTTGGNALKFYASVRIDIRRIEAIKDGTAVIGNRTRAKVIKNKVAPPFREAIFDIMYGEGISKWGELVDLGVEMGYIEKSGSWFSIGDERIGQGRDNAKQYLKEHPEFTDELEEKIRARLVESRSRTKASTAAAPAKPAAGGVNVSSDDFNDED
jgi:recombination protein RecA